LLGIVGSVAGCGKLNVPDPEANRRDGEPIFDLKAVEHNQKSARIAARSQNEFGLKLLRVVAAQKPRENTFISPTSVWMALAMAEKGARGAAQTELQRVLALQNGSDASVVALRATLKAQGLKINLANALWADKKVTFPPAFTQNNAKTFGATAQTLDFRAKNSVGAINNWVKKQTEGEISEILKKLPTSGAVLTNALYFRGRWQKPFQKSETEAAPFYGPGKIETSVPLMNGEGFSSFGGANFEGAILPYANSSCELLALLPNKGKTPLDVTANLDVDELDAIESGAPTALRLPRFMLDWDDSLVVPLRNLGLNTAFSQSADWSAMGLPPTSFISEVLHKTRLKITEEGTVASAATAVVMQTGSAKAPEPKILVFDRPFVLLLRETHSRAILFAGIVNDPQILP